MSDPMPPKVVIARDPTEEMALQQMPGWGGGAVLNNHRACRTPGNCWR
jgi:hypothetical protein